MNLAGNADDRSKVPDFACRQNIRYDRRQLKVSDFNDIKLPASSHESDTVALAHGAFEHPDVDHDAFVGIEVRVENKALEGSRGVPRRRRNPVLDSPQQVVDASPRLRTDQAGIERIYAHDFLDLASRLVDIGIWQVDLVNGDHNREVVVDGQVGIRHSLCFDPLGGIDDQHSPLACRKAARYFVVEVNMARSVNEVEHHFSPVSPSVRQTDWVSLDSDPALFLKVHLIQDLITPVLENEPGPFQKPVGERRLPVVYMRNDAEVPNPGWVHAPRLFRGNGYLTRRLEDYLLAIAAYHYRVSALELSLKDTIGQLVLHLMLNQP